MKFNADVVQKVLAEYLESLVRLNELALIPFEQFAADPHKIASAKYHFIIAIEAAIDLCNHLIAKNALRVPEDYSDTFRVMGESNLLPADFIPTLVDMAKFRNRLVHRYWDVDTAYLHRVLMEDSVDLEKFLTEVKRSLSSYSTL